MWVTGIASGGRQGAKAPSRVLAGAGARCGRGADARRWGRAPNCAPGAPCWGCLVSTLGVLPLEALQRTRGLVRRMVRGHGLAKRPAGVVKIACIAAPVRCRSGRAARLAREGDRGSGVFKGWETRALEGQPQRAVQIAPLDTPPVQF